MSRELLERFVEDRAALSADEIRALTLALAGDPALMDQAQRLLLIDELLSRIHAPDRAGFAVALPAGPAAAPPRPGSSRFQRVTTVGTPSGRHGTISGRHRGISARHRPVSSRPWVPAFALIAAVLVLAALLRTQRSEPGRLITDQPVAVAPTPPPRPAPVPSPPAKPAAPLAAAVASLSDARGATIERGGATVAAAKGDAVRVGDVLRVAEGGIAALAWTDGTAIACPGGELAIPEPKPGKRLRLVRGALTAQVAKQPLAPLVIESEHGACTVVGTRFAFAADAGGSRLDVQEGVVELARAHGATLRVGAGESASAPAAPRVPRTLRADPASLRAVADTLAPGDTLTLAPGDYQHLRLTGIRGEPDAWITITGPSSGAPARFIGDPGNNTISLVGAAYLNLRHLALDGRRVAGPFGIAANEQAGGPVHHIRIEDCVITDYGGWPDGMAISTRVPAWSWTIARNRIERCGGGMFLGSSAGDLPMVGAVIENNLVVADRAACLYLAASVVRPASMPVDVRNTIIRDNVFIRDPAEPMASPQVVIDGVPGSGPGAEDLAEVAGNLFCRNRGEESMLQASGRLAIHDNVFADGDGPAICLNPHVRPVESAWIWRNTIYAVPVGIRFLAAAQQDDLVAANLILAPQAVMGPVRTLAANLIDRPDAAKTYVANPALTFGRLDLHPLGAACRCGDWPQAKVAAFAARDFDGSERKDPRVAGAYAGRAPAGAWKPAAEPKPAPR